MKIPVKMYKKYDNLRRFLGDLSNKVDKFRMILFSAPFFLVKKSGKNKIAKKADKVMVKALARLRPFIPGENLSKANKGIKAQTLVRAEIAIAEIEGSQSSAIYRAASQIKPNEIVSPLIVALSNGIFMALMTARVKSKSRPVHNKSARAVLNDL